MTAVRVQTDPRIARRRQAVARSKRRRTLIGAAAIVIIAVVVWIMFWSPLLHVRAFKVVGTERTEEAAVVGAMGISGGGENLLLISTGALEERVERLPWVAHATVERILPGTVRVKVTEREPAFVVNIATGKWTIDREGNVLAVGRAERKLPVLSGIEVGRVEPGVTLRTPEAQDALRAYDRLPRVVRKRVVRITAPTQEAISFALADGMEIRYGGARQMKAKATVLKALLKRLKKESRSPSYVDVRVPTSPAISDDAAARAGITSSG